MEARVAGFPAPLVASLQADWVLQTTLALPWRPFIEVMGSTVYTLNPEANKVCSSPACWSITQSRRCYAVRLINLASGYVMS